MTCLDIVASVKVFEQLQLSQEVKFILQKIYYFIFFFSTKQMADKLVFLDTGYVSRFQ